METNMNDTSSRILGESPNVIANRLMQRTQNRDGLPEIAMGLSFLLVAGLIYVQSTLERGSARDKQVSLALCLLIPTAGFIAPWLVKWVRKRFLIERVGYFQPKPVRLRIVGISIVIAAAVAVLVAVSSPSTQPGWILAGSGVFGGSLAIFAGRLPRFVAGGVMLSAAGILIALNAPSLEVGFAMLWGFAGLLSLLSGCVVFLRFIRHSAATGE
jgi:hypothetical protein